MIIDLSIHPTSKLGAPMHCRSHIVQLYLAAITLLLVSCSDEESPTRPSGNGNPTVIADTTSHDFVWEKMQIGVRHTVLRDVEAISDTDVWVGGDIRMVDTYTYDSSGNYISPMNAAHWDGGKWTIQRIIFPHYGSVSTPGYSEISSIKAFGPRDVWFFAGGALAHWDGENFRTWLAPEELAYAGYMAHMEGTPGNLYFAGYDGAMMRFDGQGFHKVHTGTDQDINDIFTVNGVTVCVAGDLNSSTNNETLLLAFAGGNMRLWRDEMMYAGMVGIWFTDTSNVWLCGGGLVRSYQNTTWRIHYLPFNGFPRCIRGQAMNDIFVGGDFGNIHHFNGKSWKYYPEPAPYESEFVLRSMTYIKDNVYYVGDDIAGRNYVIYGRRVSGTK